LIPSENPPGIFTAEDEAFIAFGRTSLFTPLVSPSLRKVR